MENLSIRLEKEDLEYLEWLSKEEGEKKTALLREVLREDLRSKIIQKLAEKVTGGELSLTEASRILKEDVLTTFDLLTRHGAKISGKWPANELERQLKRIKKY